MGTNLSNFKTIILFSQSDILDLLAPIISVINVGHFLGQSCLRIWTRRRLSLDKNKRSAFKDSSVDAFLIIVAII